MGCNRLCTKTNKFIGILGGLCVPRHYCDVDKAFECGEGSVCCSVRSEGVTRFKYNQEKADDDYNDIGGLVTDEMKYK